MGAPTANVGGFRRFDAASVVRRRVTPFALPRRQRRTALDESQSLAAQRRFDAERCSRDAISSPQFLSGREFVPAADLLSCADKKGGKEAAPASSPRFARCPALLRKTAWLRNSAFSARLGAPKRHSDSPRHLACARPPSFFRCSARLKGESVDVRPLNAEAIVMRPLDGKTTVVQPRNSEAFVVLPPC